MHTVAALVADLSALGVATGDTVMVHASLRGIGPTEHRADGLIAAIDQTVGSEGTWLMMIDAENDWEWVNKEPEAQREALLADAEPFDPLVTPAARYVGALEGAPIGDDGPVRPGGSPGGSRGQRQPEPAAKPLRRAMSATTRPYWRAFLAEAVRVAPATGVSDQPEGRFAARGREAEALVADVAWDHYYGPGSPLERLVDRQGRVLRLGADPDTVTLLHLAEQLCAVPDKRIVRRHRRVTGPDGPRVVVVETFDDSNGIVPYRPPGAEPPGETTRRAQPTSLSEAKPRSTDPPARVNPLGPDGDYFVTILEAYRATGRVATGRVGGADAELIDAADLVAFAVPWMEENLVAAR